MEVEDVGRGSGMGGVVCGEIANEVNGADMSIEYRDFFHLAEYGLQLLNI